MLRVYNEGSMAGYAAQIKDHLPEYLEFVDGDFNKKYGWEVSEDGRTVTTKYLSDDKYLIEAAVEKNGKIELDYKDVPIMCKVTSNAQGIITICGNRGHSDKNKNKKAFYFQILCKYS